MAYNSGEAFNSALSLFSSLYQDMEPTDLPEGLSPDNQDVWFLPGSVSTRPALNKLFPDPPSFNNRVMSVAEFPTPSGDFLTVFLDSAGNLNQNDVETGLTTSIDLVTAGVQFKAVTAFDKQWCAFFGQQASEQFSANPFVGVDIPRYYNGDRVSRVTQDAPGSSPTFGSLSTQSIPLVQSAVSGTLTVTAASGTGVKIVNPGAHQQLYFTQIFYTCSAPVPVDWLGQPETVTGLTGTNASMANITAKVALVSGTHFTVNLPSPIYGDPGILNLSGQSGTATTAGNYLVRQNNIVTAYVGTTQPTFLVPGLFVKVINGDNSAINQTLGTITAIVRDANGVVTVTINKQLTNLASGTKVNISGVTDGTNFAASTQTVVSVISAAGGTTIFTLSWSGAAASSSAGTVTETWSGTFQILSVGNDPTNGWFITYFQLGPDTGTNVGTPLVQVQSQVAPGIRNAVAMFQSFDGAITAPSIPVQVSVVGGTSVLQAQNIPIGPPGTAARIIAFTPALGSKYFYLNSALVPSINGLPPVLSLGTIINDNTTTSTIFDFSDVALVAGISIDTPGNNLFNQIVLAPCLGVIEYQSRLFWWGEINNIKNLLNMGFDGGYNPGSGTVNTSGTSVTWVSGTQFVVGFWNGSQIQINGVLYEIDSVAGPGGLTLSTSAGTQTGVPFTVFNPAGVQTVPPAWSSAGSTGGTSSLQVSLPNDFGFSYLMTSAGGTNDCMISQPAYQNYYGAPILIPNKTYIWRLKVGANAQTSGNLVADFYSPSQGVLATASIPFPSLPIGSGYVQATFDGPTPQTIPSDTLFRIYLQNVPAGAIPAPGFALIDEPELIDSAQPVLYNQMRASYINNPFGYDAITGVVGADTSESFVGAFTQRGYLYILTDDSLFNTQNNGTTEPNEWPVSQFAQNCGCCSPCAVGVGAGVAMWAGRYGHQLFTGDTPKKISQECQPTWDRINWTAETSVWLVHDPVERIIYIGLPLDTATAPSVVYPVSYRSVDSVYNVPDPLHISYSGKLITSDLCRKSTIWNVQANCGAMVTRDTGQGNAKQMIFGSGNGQDSGSAFGNLYYLNFNKFTDDNYGVINSYYTTYFHWNHDMEANVPPLGLHRKIYTYLSAFITGVGNIQITPLVDSLTNPWQPMSTTWDALNQVWATSTVPNPLPAYELTQTLDHDLEWPLNVIGDRVAFKISVSPLEFQTDAYFSLQHIVVAGRMDKVFPVRGAYL